MYAEAKERAVHVTEHRGQRWHGDRNYVGKRALRNSNRLRERLRHGGSFFGLATACIPHAGKRSRHLPFIRSTNSGTSPPAGSKSEPRRGFSCIRRGAYGAVGFRGVTDAPTERPSWRRFSD